MSHAASLHMFLAVPLLCAACVVKTEIAKGGKGDKGDPGVTNPTELANVQASIQTLEQKVATLEEALSAQAETNKQLKSIITTLEGTAYCPRVVDHMGNLRVYTADLSSPGIILCKFGADEMVKVGPSWIDRYEASLVDSNFYTNTTVSPSTPSTCDGVGVPFGSIGGGAAIDDYPQTFPDNGYWTVPLYACSVAAQVPSQWMTWFQAQQSCATAGKRLCRNDEWQAAAAGTPDPGSSPGSNGACVTDANEPRAAGGGTACRSSYGVEDMVGNIQEWVADWAGTPVFNEADAATPDFWGSDYGDDVLFDIGGLANDTNLGGLHRRPAAWLRGGAYKLGSGGQAVGAFAASLYNAPSSSYLRVGVRCCVGPG